MYTRAGARTVFLLESTSRLSVRPMISPPNSPPAARITVFFAPRKNAPTYGFNTTKFRKFRVKMNTVAVCRNSRSTSASATPWMPSTAPAMACSRRRRVSMRR